MPAPIRAATDKAAQRGVNWWVWRIVLAERVPDGLTQVRRWPLSWQLDAHLALDAMGEVDEYHRETAERRERTANALRR